MTKKDFFEFLNEFLGNVQKEDIIIGSHPSHHDERFTITAGIRHGSRYIIQTVKVENLLSKETDEKLNKVIAKYTRWLNEWKIAQDA